MIARSILLLLLLMSPQDVFRRRPLYPTSTATFTETQHKITDSTATGSTLSITVTSTTLGHDLVVCIGATTTGATPTVSDNGSGGSNTYTRRLTATGVNGTAVQTDCFDSLTTTNGSVTSISASWGGANSTYRMMCAFEVSRNTGTSVFDAANGTSGATGSGTTANGPTYTSTGGYAVAVIVPNDAISSNPKSGNNFTSGGDILVNGPACASLMTSTAGSQQPVWLLNTSGDPFAASVIGEK